MVGWFVDTMMVASGLAVVAAMASRLRSIGPTARHALWLVVLVRLVTPPLVCGRLNRPDRIPIVQPSSSPSVRLVLRRNGLQLGRVAAAVEVEAEITLDCEACGQPSHGGRHLGIAAHTPRKGIVVGHPLRDAACGGSSG